jgi:rare lipoprotein A
VRAVAAPALALLLLMVAWAAPAQELDADAAQPPSGFETEGFAVPAADAGESHGRGLASWYGPRFHGRRTASGERFDMHALTAAHPTLPFGTVVRVEVPQEGRSVDVRINDRGPHIKQRVIDLSRAAARALGMLDPGGGLKEVVVRIVRKPAP